MKNIYKRAIAALESSSKRGSFASGVLEYRHLLWEVGEEEKTFRHQTFDFLDLGVEKKKLNVMRKNSESHSQSHSESYYWNLSYFI